MSAPRTAVEGALASEVRRLLPSAVAGICAEDGCSRRVVPPSDGTVHYRCPDCQRRALTAAFGPGAAS